MPDRTGHQTNKAIHSFKGIGVFRYRDILKIHFFKKLTLFLCLCVYSLFSQAQTPSLIAAVTKNPVGNGEQFQLTFTLNANGSDFQAPKLTDFNVLSGPNQSTSMQFVNGAMSQSIILSYYLQAKSEGTFTIGPGSVICGGKKNNIQSNNL